MKVTAKEKVNLSFDIAANASTVRYDFLLIFNGLWARRRGGRLIAMKIEIAMKTENCNENRTISCLNLIYFYCR